MSAHQKSVAVKRKLECCRAWMKSFLSVASYHDGRCQIQSATACTIVVTNGPVMKCHDFATGGVAAKWPIFGRHLAGVAHRNAMSDAMIAAPMLAVRLSASRCRSK